jgi:hypothetical protein
VFQNLQDQSEAKQYKSEKGHHDFNRSIKSPRQSPLKARIERYKVRHGRDIAHPEIPEAEAEFPAIDNQGRAIIDNHAMIQARERPVKSLKAILPMAIRSVRCRRTTMESWYIATTTYHGCIFLKERHIGQVLYRAIECM